MDASLLSAALDALPDGVCVFVGERAAWANAAFRASFGGEVEGATADELKRRNPAIELEQVPTQDGFLLLARERPRVEARLLQADRLVSIGSLAAGISHEINNPLAYVIANLQFLAEKLVENQDPELRKALRHAREGADRAQHVVKQLHGFSHAGESARAPVDLRRILESAAEMVGNEIRHRARLTLQLVPVEPVLGNEAQLKQVFVNLLVNAAHAIPEDGASHHEISLSLHPQGGRAVVEVRDSGSGIAPENLKRIFEPFFTTKLMGAGSGLGLSICHGVVTAHGGEITVESELGKGALFRVVLPFMTVTKPPPAREASTPWNKGRGRVLVIDDEPRIGTAIRRTLAAHDVTALSSAREAIAALEGGAEFDLVLCDLMMPEMSGMEFFEAVTRDHPALARRIIFLTGGAFTPRAQAFLAEVPNARMDKPFDPKQLRALVDTLLR
jgi:signal transduction histidine kinase